MAPDLTLTLELSGVAVVAGFIDAIAGGGGLLTLPALLLAGLDPISALGTNKLQGSAGSLSATFAFARRHLIDWRIGLRFVAAAGVASLLGALSISLLPRNWLDALVPVLLLAFAGYFSLGRGIREGDGAAKMPTNLFAATFIPLVGFYDGFFGPGAGTFYMIGITTLLGFGAVRATGYTKAANAASNVGSLLLFASKGVVIWPLGLAMALGAFLGAQLGARLAMRLGAKLIRPLLIVTSGLMALRLLSRDGGPLHALLALVP